MSLYEELEKEEQLASGGGGTVGKVKLELGFKIFVSGLDNRSSFFAYIPGNEKSRKDALARAKAVLKTSGADSNPQASLQIVIYRETVKGRTVGWKDDRFLVVPIWTPGYKEIVKPHMKGVELGEMWARIVWAVDPSGREHKDETDLDDNGQPKMKPEMIAFVSKVYKNEAEAEADAGAVDDETSSAPVAETNSNIPPGWLPKAWDGIKAELKKAVAGGQSIAQVAADYGVDVKYVAAAISS